MKPFYAILIVASVAISTFILFDGCHEEPPVVEPEAESAALDEGGPDAAPSAYYVAGGLRLYPSGVEVSVGPSARVFVCPGGVYLVGPPHASPEDICAAVRP